MGRVAQEIHDQRPTISSDLRRRSHPIALSDFREGAQPLEYLHAGLLFRLEITRVEWKCQPKIAFACTRLSQIHKRPTRKERKTALTLETTISPKSSKFSYAGCTFGELPIGAPMWIRTTGLPLRRKVICGFCHSDQEVESGNSVLCRVCALIRYTSTGHFCPVPSHSATVTFAIQEINGS